MLVITSFFLVGGVAHLNFSLARLIDNPGGWSLENSADAVGLFHAIGMDAARLLLPVVVVLAVAGILSSFLQNAPRLVLERMRPQLSRLSIAKGWKRIFGAQGQVEFLKALFKLVAIAVLGFLLLRVGPARRHQRHVHGAGGAAGPHPVAWPRGSSRPWRSPPSCSSPPTSSGRACSGTRELKMTRQEVKDELKQADGDPIVKARMRSLARDRLRKRMIAAVPRATLVIANPTHYAVALRYVREEGGAPLVVAKGQDLIALTHPRGRRPSTAFP